MKKVYSLSFLLVMGVVSAQVATPEQLVSFTKAVDGKTIEFPVQLVRDWLDLKSDMMQMKAYKMLSMAKQIKSEALKRRYYKTADTMFDLAGMLGMLPLPKEKVEKTFKNPMKWLMLKAKKMQLKAEKLKIIAKEVDNEEMGKKADELSEWASSLMKLVEKEAAAEREDDEAED